MSSMTVKHPGLLSLIQDMGRFGKHNLGLTTGGPLDFEAFAWANRILGNELNATSIEISFGGLALESKTHTSVVVTGAETGLKLNGNSIDQWRSFDVKPGDIVETGFATSGVRAYLAIAGGFEVNPQFGSSSTVVREKIGGLIGDKLQINDQLVCASSPLSQHFELDISLRPTYSTHATLRVVKGYQHEQFDHMQQWRFFSSEYKVTERSDRMGFRLEGEVVKSNIVGMLSEGICHGAIQIPADGQPIVLMNDRQTIGGYPKIGSVIPQDTARLSQLSPGSTIRFEEISIEQAHNIHHLDKARFEHITLNRC
ncbi:MAG: biotin-dependent carboxylase-like uncharacterized protein [Gammaproteobacteria bacterium]|jgi:biotin-dependent carboxylase-like uncharacterized protein